jgi:uncharacterized protein (TIGR02598 family)
MKSSCGFSLTETVIALGLFAFCILPIIGLMPVGMGAVRSVAQEAQAADLAEAFLGAWQVRPTNTNASTFFSITNMFTNPQVPLGQGSDTMYFAGDGTQKPNASGASMQLDYKITTTATNATVDLNFYWPPGKTNAAAQKRSFTGVFPR